MKQITLTILLINLSLFAKSQELTWNSSIQIPDKETHHSEIINATDTTVVISRYGYGLKAKPIYYLDIINRKDGAIVSTKEIVPPKVYENQETLLRDYFFFKTKLILISTFDKNADNSSELYCTEIDVKTGKMGLPKLLATQRDDNNEISGGFHVRTSQDSSKLLVSSFRTDLYSPFQDITCKVYDANLELLNQKEFSLKSETKSSKIQNTVVTNNGDIIIIANMRKKEFKSDYSYTPPTSHQLIYHSFKSNLSTTIPIKFSDSSYVASNIKLKENNDGFSIVGLVGHPRFVNIIGCFNLHFDFQTAKLSQQKIVYFDNNTLKELLGLTKGWEKKDNGNHYLINEIIFTSNNKLKIVAEQCLTRDEAYLRVGLPSYLITQEEKEWIGKVANIIVLSFDTERNFEWLKLIPKDQQCGQGLCMSNFRYNSNDNLYLLYNDNPVNLKGKDQFGPRKYIDPYKSITVLTSISDNGNVNSIPFINDKSNKVVVKPVLTYRLNQNEFLIYSSNKNQFKLGKLTFNK